LIAEYDCTAWTEQFASSFTLWWSEPFVLAVQLLVEFKTHTEMPLPSDASLSKTERKVAGFSLSARLEKESGASSWCLGEAPSEGTKSAVLGSEFCCISP
jgi:hypothetical protein